MMSQEIPYGSTLEYGTWATFDEATRTYKVRVIDRRQGYPQFVDVDMPERNKAGVRRINVIHCNSTYTTADGYNTEWACTTNWSMEDGSREMYGDMLNEVDSTP
jgi:hypothetical protein